MNFQICKISEFRTAIMGFAALWVLLYHSWPYAFVFPFDLGYHGVDLFFLVSGFGLYYSRKKNKERYWIFIRKRLLRVLPLYIIVVFLLDIMSGKTINTTVLDICMAYYFVPINIYEVGANFWYVPAIIIYYLLFPWLYNLIESKERLKYIWIIFVLCVLLLCVSVYFTYNISVINWQFNFLFTRFLFFVIGAYLGRLSFLGESVFGNKRYIVFAFLLGIILIYYLNSLSNKIVFLHQFTIFVIPFYFSIVGTVCLIVFISKNKSILRILNWFGSRSYEIYLATSINVIHPYIFKLIGVSYCCHFKKLLLSYDCKYIFEVLLIYAVIVPAIVLLTSQMLHVINIGIVKYLK